MLAGTRHQATTWATPQLLMHPQGIQATRQLLLAWTHTTSSRQLVKQGIPHPPVSQATPHPLQELTLTSSSMRIIIMSCSSRTQGMQPGRAWTA